MGKKIDKLQILIVVLQGVCNKSTPFNCTFSRNHTNNSIKRGICLRIPCIYNAFIIL